MAAPSVSGGYTEINDLTASAAITGTGIVPTNDENANAIETPDATAQTINGFRSIQHNFVTADRYVFGRRDDATVRDLSDADLLLSVAVRGADVTSREDELAPPTDQGLMIGVADTLNNYAYWTIGGDGQTQGGLDTILVFVQTFVALDLSRAAFKSGTDVDLTDIDTLAFLIHADKSGLVRVCFKDLGTVAPFVVTQGETGDRGNFNDILAQAQTTPGVHNNVALGLMARAGTKQYSLTGKVEFGDGGATTVWFEDSFLSLDFAADEQDTDTTEKIRYLNTNYSGFYFDVTSDYNVTIEDSTFNSGSGWTLQVTPNGNTAETLSLKRNNFFGCGLVTLDAPGDFTGSRFGSCAQIDMNSANLTNCVVTNSTDAGGAVLYDDNGTLTGVEFDGNTVDIRIPSTAPASITLTNNTYTASPGDVNIIDLRTGTPTITVSGGTTPTFRNDGGGTTTLVAPNPPVSVTVVTRLGVAIENARVFIKAASGGSLAAGTEILNALTNASGVASTTVSISGDQPIEGWARKSTGTPLYKQGDIVGSIDDPDGFSTTVVMVLDE